MVLTRGCRLDMDRRIRVYAKLCQSMMNRAPCLTLASQHIARVGMAGGTCISTSITLLLSYLNPLLCHLSLTVHAGGSQMVWRKAVVCIRGVAQAIYVSVSGEGRR